MEKELRLHNIEPKKRGGKGVLTVKTTDKIGKMITIKEVVGTDDLMIIRDDGVLIRMPVSQIRSIGRATQGVRLIKLGKGTKVSSITRIISEEEKKTDESPTTEENSPQSEEN